MFRFSTYSYYKYARASVKINFMLRSRRAHALKQKQKQFLHCDFFFRYFFRQNSMIFIACCIRLSGTAKSYVCKMEKSKMFLCKKCEVPQHHSIQAKKEIYNIFVFLKPFCIRFRVKLCFIFHPSF